MKEPRFKSGHFWHGECSGNGRTPTVESGDGKAYGWRHCRVRRVTVGAGETRYHLVLFPDWRVRE